MKKIEEQLPQQSDYRLMVEKFPIGIAVVKQNRFLFANKKFRSLFGIRADSEWSVADIAGEAYQEKIAATIKHVQSNNSRSVQLEFKGRSKRGTITCLGIFSLISFEGAPCVELVVRNITRRKELEEESIQNYRAAEDNLKRLDALYKISEQVDAPKSFKSTIKKILNFCIDLTGATTGFVSLKNPRKNRFETTAIIMPEDQCQFGNNLPQLNHTLSIIEHSRKIKTRIYDKEDIKALKLPEKHFPIESCMIVPLVRKKTLTGFIGLANHPHGFSPQDEKLIKTFANHINIAIENARLFRELKTSYATLKNTEFKLIQSEKIASVGLLAAGIAHEFNNIMSNIYLYAQLAAMDPDSKDYLVDVALTQSKRAMNTTKALLSFSRRQEGVLEYLDLTQIIEEVIRLTQKEIDRQNIHIEKAFSPLPFTLADTATIQQVFLNMIINARQAIGRDGLITIKTESDNRWIYIVFEDNGCGIPKENINKIFEPFFSTKIEEENGSGLGLYVSYNIVKEAKGDIRVKSEVGKGTQFTIRLPIIEERRRSDELVLIDRRSAREKRQRYKILAIDRNEAVLKLIKSVLEKRKHRVWITSAGEEALDLFKKRKFNYVFLDTLLGGSYNSFHIFKEIKKINKSAKIIFLTEKENKLQNYIDKTEKVLKKPIEISQIVDAIV